VSHRLALFIWEGLQLTLGCEALDDALGMRVLVGRKDGLLTVIRAVRCRRFSTSLRKAVSGVPVAYMHATHHWSRAPRVCRKIRGKSGRGKFGENFGSEWVAHPWPVAMGPI